MCVCEYSSSRHPSVNTDDGLRPGVVLSLAAAAVAEKTDLGMAVSATVVADIRGGG